MDVDGALRTFADAVAAVVSAKYPEADGGGHVRSAAPPGVRRFFDQRRLHAREGGAPRAAGGRNRARGRDGAALARTRPALQRHRTGRRIHQPAAGAARFGTPQSNAFCAREIASAKSRATGCASRSSSAARIRRDRSSSCRAARCRSARRSPMRCASRGYDVFVEWIINDAGRQLDALGRSVYARYRQLFDPSYPFPEEGYPGEYLVPIARQIRERDGERWTAAGESEWLPYFSKFGARRDRRRTAAHRAAFRRGVRPLAERTRAARGR